jgi:hypothetical protein
LINHFLKQQKIKKQIIELRKDLDHVGSDKELDDGLKAEIVLSILKQIKDLKSKLD